MSENAGTFPAEVLRIEASHDGTRTTITLEGEFDMTGTDRFWAFVSQALGTRGRSPWTRAASNSSTRRDCWRCCVPVTLPSRPVSRSVSAIRRRRFGAWSRLPASRICWRTGDAKPCAVRVSSQPGGASGQLAFDPVLRG
jgi:hypothetical protein